MLKFKVMKKQEQAKTKTFDIIESHIKLVDPSITNHISDIIKHEETEILYSFFRMLLSNKKLMKATKDYGLINATN